MKTALDFYDDENPDGRVPFEWPVLSRPATSTARVSIACVWEWDGPTVDWSAAASEGTILDWQEERQRGR